MIEDEPISSSYLKKQIRDLGVKHRIVAEITSVNKAIEFFSSDKDYDLVLMDIHLEDGDCFQILNNVSVEKPIIFCTTFDTYAVKAFKYNSIDYIIKPVKKDALENALKKYLALKKLQDNSHLERVDKMMDYIAPTVYKKRFLVRSGNKLKLVLINQGVCFYSNEGDTVLIDNNGIEHIIDFTLERLEKILDPQCFFRINRKVTLSMDYIHSVEDYFNNRLIVKMQKKIPLDLVVSRNRVKDFKLWLKGIS